VLDALEANPALKATTAVFVTVDEAGGYWTPATFSLWTFSATDRAFLFWSSRLFNRRQDPPRLFSHASIVKFIERNWSCSRLTDRSRDNLPNPVVKEEESYVPTNSRRSAICSTRSISRRNLSTSPMSNEAAQARLKQASNAGGWVIQSRQGGADRTSKV